MKFQYTVKTAREMQSLKAYFEVIRDLRAECSTDRRYLHIFELSFSFNYLHH